jgi:hypothetical protein
MNPILTVDGDPSDWLPIPESFGDGWRVHSPTRDTVRIDGDLPTVTEEWTGGYDYDGMPLPAPRPLRVGDKVTLATVWKDSDDEWCQSSFATATVARIEKHIEMTGSFALVTVSDVEALDADRPGRTV